MAGDLHGIWNEDDQELLCKLKPDGILFVGDLGEGDISIVKAIKKIPFPKAVILGNHDHGHDRTGQLLRTQLNLLGDIDCSWKLKKWSNLSLSLVGARPCSSGGGFYISSEVQAVFGPISMDQSADRIFKASIDASKKSPLIILAHSGPAGLGSDRSSPCGRDWKSPPVDWGDKDLSSAIDQIRRNIKVPELVVFGHTHHYLKRGKGKRITFIKDVWGTAYLNAACVPRRGKDLTGQDLCHFSWVEFKNNQLSHVSHRWFRNDASLAYEEVLLSESSLI